MLAKELVALLHPISQDVLQVGGELSMDLREGISSELRRVVGLLARVAPRPVGEGGGDDGGGESEAGDQNERGAGGCAELGRGQLRKERVVGSGGEGGGRSERRPVCDDHVREEEKCWHRVAYGSGRQGWQGRMECKEQPPSLSNGAISRAYDHTKIVAKACGWSIKAELQRISSQSQKEIRRKIRKSFAAKLERDSSQS
eukprot:6175912-Pleurochrysis_carterae.AAC.1